MKNFLAVMALLSSQFTLAEVQPMEIMEVSDGLTGAKMTYEIETTALTAEECTNSWAQTYSLAYPASGNTNSLILHRGRHEATFVNCTGSGQNFYVQYELTSGSTDERFYIGTNMYIPDQSQKVVNANSSFYASYFFNGRATVTAKTTVSGPGSHNSAHSSYININ